MSDLSGLNLDANVQENDGEFTVLPAGKYKMVMVGDELKDNKAMTGKILVVKLQIIEGQFAQEIVKDNINITNPSPQCQAIGQGTLKRICNMCQVPYPPQDTNGLMGKPMVVTIGVEEFTSNVSGKTLKSNKVKKYEAGNTAMPQQAAQAQPAQQGNNGQAQPVQQASGW